MRVLLIEDYAPTRHAMQELLELEGFSVAPAATVEEGLNRLVPRPDWVLLDLMLPDGDGEDVLWEIRSRHMQTKVAILTGVTDRDRLGRVHALHPDLVISKPIDLDELIEKLTLYEPA